ncbi:MAG: BrnT family toxin [Spirochaetota bacterium]
MNFEWDPSKAEANLRKHGVSFERAAFVFSDRLNITLLDHVHSGTETRWVTIGQVQSDVLLVVHSYPLEPDDTTIRVISARLVTAREREYYR